MDEAGRGPLAGPVVAGAVCFTSPRPKFAGLKDSKRLSAKQRERFYKLLTGNPKVKWATGKSSEKVIDKINILEATRLAMKKAVLKLGVKADLLIVDGLMTLDVGLPQRALVKADEKINVCKAASIIAKVTRDRIMVKLDQRYPGYGFYQHKGYPTRLHYRMLREHGPCRIHRRTFRLLKRFD